MPIPSNYNPTGLIFLSNQYINYQAFLNFHQIQPNQINEGRIPVNIAGVSDNNPPGFPLKIQIALKCNFDAMFFFVPCSLSVLIVKKNKIINLN